MAESSESGVKGRRPIVVALIVASLLLPQLALPAFAQTEGAYEVCLLDAINDSRAAAGADALTMASDLVPSVREYSEWMRHHSFQHMSGSARNAILPDGTFTWGENIAMWGDPSAHCDRAHDMLMNSPGHRANILNPSFRYVALGAHIDSSGEWVTELFFNANGYTPGINGHFWDDDTSIFESAIEKFAAAGNTQGCNPPVNDRFCPDDYVTRGMMAAFLVRGLGLTDPGNVDFIDDNGSTFESAIEKLAAAGITQGCNPPQNNRFCPNQYVTRGMMAAFLVRGLELTDQGNVDFIDDNGSLFEDAIEKLAAAGITQGCNPPQNNRFCPNDVVTRGMMAAFLVRGLDL
ncbi:MAG TPA: CAP domain-containing protein [Acidimicrobiia bacterium]